MNAEFDWEPVKEGENKCDERPLISLFFIDLAAAMFNYSNIPQVKEAGLNDLSDVGVLFKVNTRTFSNRFYIRGSVCWFTTQENYQG